jgi:hypothetical protein
LGFVGRHVLLVKFRNFKSCLSEWKPSIHFVKCFGRPLTSLIASFTEMMMADGGCNQGKDLKP